MHVASVKHLKVETIAVICQPTSVDLQSASLVRTLACRTRVSPASRINLIEIALVAQFKYGSWNPKDQWAIYDMPYKTRDSSLESRNNYLVLHFAFQCFSIVSILIRPLTNK